MLVVAGDRYLILQFHSCDLFIISPRFWVSWGVNLLFFDRCSLTDVRSLVNAYCLSIFVEGYRLLSCQ